MIPLSNVNWGPSDALRRDSKFASKWIEPTSIKKCLLPNYWIISGEKGSGKSAIRRALTEIYNERYLAVPVVDFNKITFKALYENLVELANTTKLSKTATLSHYWQYAMLVELISASAKAHPERYARFLKKIPRTRVDIPLSERLMQLLEDAWNKIDVFTGRGVKRNKHKIKAANLIASSGLTADILSDLNEYPLDDKFIEMRQRYFQCLENANDRVVLVLDGFDKLRNSGSSNESIPLIFASLVDAVQSIYTYEDIPSGLEIKAFIPHDRYISLTLRDSDKVDTMHTAIKWTRDDLKEFLNKRMLLTPKLRQGSFTTLWKQVMPEKVFNMHYKLEEESFDYILRHTMLRPRQLQVHLETLSSEYHDQIINSSGVPKVVAESSKKVAMHFVNEFRTEHPHLERFISSLHQKDNVIEYREFRKYIENAIDRFHGGNPSLTVEHKVDTLYAMGFFGVINFIESSAVLGNIYCPPTRERKRHHVNFFFKNPHPTISSTLKDDDLIGIHPVFVDYANLRPHPTLIVG